MDCYWSVKKQANLLATFGMATALGLLSTRAEIRKFTDVKGREINAEFIDLQGEKATLRLATGKIVAVDLVRLSKADQEFINNHPAGKLKPVELPAKPLYAVRDWSERLKSEESYFIDQSGKRGIARYIRKIHFDGFASGHGEYAVIEAPNLGVIDTAGRAQFGISAVGPPGLEAGSDAPIFLGRYGKGAESYVMYLRRDGNPFIKQRFADGRPFRSERAWVNIEAPDKPSGNKNGLWTLIDYKGNLLHAFEDLEVQDFSEGRAGVALDTKANEWAIINTDAEVIAEGPFRRVGRFIDGAAVVDGRLMTVDGKWLMEDRGEWVIERRHENSESDAVIARRTARNSNKTRYAILRRSTAEHLADIPDHFYVGDGFFNGLAVVRNDKTHKHGYLTRTGVMLIADEFATGARFHNGFAEVGVKSLHDRAVINMAGEVIWRPRVRVVIEAPKAKPENPKPDEKKDKEKDDK
ncbi:MAG: SHD1 domain-containing protein [Roseibacillus sp.]|jgi:hypothetical protein